MDPIPTYVYPELEIVEEVIDDGYTGYNVIDGYADDYEIPIDLDYYLSDDYYTQPYEEPVYSEPAYSYSPKPYYAPVYDDLDFLYDFQP